MIGSIRGCSKKRQPIAELSEILAGSAEKSAAKGTWSVASPGDGFWSGDALRTSEDGASRIEFTIGQGALRLGPATTIRFGEILDLDGEVENVSPGKAGLNLTIGRAELAKGAKIRVSGGEEQADVLVLVGSATISTRDNVFELTAGQSISLSVRGGTVTELPDTPDAGVPAVIDAAPIDAAISVAEISALVRGRGVKVKRTPEAKSERLRAGAHQLPAGAVLSIRRGSSVAFSREGEQAKVSGTAEATIGQPGGPIASVAKGRIRVSGKAVATTVKVPGGSIVARQGGGRGSVADVSVGRSKSKITPRSGRVSVIGRARETIQIGESAELTRRGDIAVIGRQPKIADFSIPAGESASVHDPGAPTALRVRFDKKCPGDGIVEWGSGRSKRPVRGTGSSIVLLRPGSHRYAVKCLTDNDVGKVVASGRIRLDRSSGTKPLPRKPNSNSISADGQNYKVLYQNLLPNLTINWPDAPAGSYKLFVKQSGSSAKVFKTRGPKHRINSGEIPEGVHRFWFEGNGNRSKEGLLTIVFDNAATSGYLRKPKVGGSWGGGQVTLIGAGIRGSRVAVRGVRLPLDRQYRFSASVSKPGNEDALAIRFSHPKRGVHYYVRRNGRR